MSAVTNTITDIFPTKTVVIIGDLVADQFLNGTISRVSREAPVFILKHEETSTRAGAAANAAVNVASLGGNAILVGITGDDQNGRKLIEKLREQGVDTGPVECSGHFSTTTKVRVLAGQHYAPRQPNLCRSKTKPRRHFAKTFAMAAVSADAIIISDYNCRSFLRS